MGQARRLIDMKSSPESPDITTDKVWLEEQQNRLLGFEILNHALRAQRCTISLYEIREKTTLNQLAPDHIYRKRFIPLLLKELGADNFQEALAILRRVRDEVH